MEQRDKDKLYQVLIVTSEFYKHSLSEPVINLYFEVLKQYEIEDIERAIQFHIGNTEIGQFFPKPADIIRQISGTSEEKALAAWYQVHEAVKQYGYIYTMTFPDPVIHMVVEGMGGWIELCQMETEKVPFYEREFVRQYQMLSRHPRPYPVKLLGWLDRQNRIAGYENTGRYEIDVERESKRLRPGYVSPPEIEVPKKNLGLAVKSTGLIKKLTGKMGVNEKKEQ